MTRLLLVYFNWCKAGNFCVDTALDKKKIFFLTVSLFFILSTGLQAQEKRPFKDLIYADAKLGFLLFHDLDAGTLNYQLTGSLAYRIDENHGLGISFHAEGVGGSYVGTGFQGVGGDYRFMTRSGFIFKAGGGPIIKGYRYVDYPFRYDYTGGGYFVDFSLDYQLPAGITLGVYYSFAEGMNFESYETADWTISGVEEFVGLVDAQQNNFGISIGFAFPWRRLKMRN